ncbi:MAG: Anaerobic nitric oxide reductase transcription regulator NorR [Ignavibacteria bacterium]|nr:Anaerobic nitric oxide reductase transcription regulator NorR [Ignavibacteria bacterium]
MQKLLGNSIQIIEINDTIKQVAPTDVSILITGESGVGKEVVANSIHELSKRKNEPLIIVNCGAIPEGIIESELFGHQKGAFTGAVEDRRGYFEMADKGTIFLDEIGDVPLSTQVKFLRVLETGEFMRVGGTKKISVNVRIIAATNKDLSGEVLQKNFREDLYYRLRSINIYIPPLRERKPDIKLLFDYFIETYCSGNNLKFAGIKDDAMDFIINYNWPGNARELKNFCESIIVLHPNKVIELEDVKKHLLFDRIEMPRSLPVIMNKTKESYEKDFLFRALLELKSDILDIKEQLDEIKNGHKDNITNQSEDFVIKSDKVKNMTMDEIEKEVLIYMLEINNWNVAKVSEILKQSPRNVYKKITKYNIKSESRWRNI